jgi:hypothetical protein
MMLSIAAEPYGQEPYGIPNPACLNPLSPVLYNVSSMESRGSDQASIELTLYISNLFRNPGPAGGRAGVCGFKNSLTNNF